MKPEFFYSATRTRRPRLVALEDADEMFVQLDNGNLSDVGDTEDEEDDDFIFEEAGSDDCTLETRETSDELDEIQACKETSCLKVARASQESSVESAISTSASRNCFKEFHVHH
ncbi:hypothetical protein HPB50_005550 [Hyalomma asiaticum]|uniref:Uncharacterized protein n=1 Tax=Hyalomma asiaticum TaxID=266040 RepID=A0ACB7SLD2_HYAAI|nr:hypothetical protein HPB50_005550 [Hyalomma asiaticum]